ncbi:MAG: MFS transporter [Thermoplasmatota archaeon]
MEPAALRRFSTPAFRFVLFVGIVSLLADFTYEGARSSTGQFLGQLGATGAVVGIVAGLGELLGYSIRFISGRLADRTRQYWPISIFGYCVNLLAVPALAIVPSLPLAALFILLERTGKAIRSPSRNAMLSHAAHELGRGWTFGFHEAMDQVGATIGPLVMAAVLLLGRGYRTGFALLLLPALAALAALLLARRAFPNPENLEPAAPKFARRGFPRSYWVLVAAGALAGAAVVDFALIAFHASTLGLLAPFLIPVLYAIANAISAVAAFGWGAAADRWGPSVLPVALVLWVFAAPLLFLGGDAALIIGLLLWGVVMGAVETLFKTIISHLAHAGQRASAFGTFDGIFGIAWFVGSAAMGILYDVGPVYTVALSVLFGLGAVFVSFAAARVLRSGGINFAGSDSYSM